jgi:hypothetical protein
MDKIGKPPPPPFFCSPPPRLSLVQAFTASSWVVEFEFKVKGVSHTLFGDGFAFWYTADKMEQGDIPSMT